MQIVRWPFPGQLPIFPDAPGRFGAFRRHDRHTGVDVYGNKGQPVIAMEEGVVVAVEAFTGAHVTKPEDRSPHWNDTWAVLIEGESGVILYGEIRPSVTTNQRVRMGEQIGVILPVLRKFKGRPMVMLHLELLRTGSRASAPWWKLDQPQDERVLDPTPLLRRAAGDTFREFDMKDYDGQEFRDPDAAVDIRYAYGSRPAPR